MGKRENVVETYLHNEVLKIHGTTRKWEIKNYAGIPDRIVFLKDGDIWFVEVKTIDGTLSSAQIREHLKLRGFGANIITVLGKEGVDRFINDIK